MSPSIDLLFCQPGILELPRHVEQKMYEAIDAIDANRLLNTSLEDLCAYFDQEYRINVPVLKEGEITVDQTEAKIDVSREPFRFNPLGERIYVPGTTVTYFVPFDGDAGLFRLRASTFTFNPPRAEVGIGELRMRFTFEASSPDRLKSQFEKTLGEIRQNLDQMRKDVGNHNASVRTKAKARIEARRQKLLNDQGLVASLGYRLRRRDDAPMTYVAPVVRKKARVQMPSAGTEPFKPEPTLGMQEYESVLSILSNMVAVIERSPAAFRQMKEEDIRQHFLVQLNGQYEGQATGETFNFEGKTDILIRAKGRNIFVAECKFWHGPKAFIDTIDQLLRYASWRDTKTAMLLFNRTKNLSQVLVQIPDLVNGHSNFKRRLPSQSETSFRFVLHHRDDKNREMILTVAVFEVPTCG